MRPLRPGTDHSAGWPSGLAQRAGPRSPGRRARRAPPRQSGGGRHCAGSDCQLSLVSHTLLGRIRRAYQSLGLICWRVLPACGIVPCHRLCIGACCTLHVANAQPSCSARSCSPVCGVCCGCAAARLGEGQAVAAAVQPYRLPGLDRSAAPDAVCAAPPRHAPPRPARCTNAVLGVCQATPRSSSVRPR